MFGLISKFLERFFTDDSFRSFVLLIMLVISWTVNSRLREKLTAAEHKLKRLREELP